MNRVSGTYKIVSKNLTFMLLELQTEEKKLSADKNVWQNRGWKPSKFGEKI